MALRTRPPVSSHAHSEHPMFTDHPGLHAEWKTRLFGSLQKSTWTDVPHGVWHWVHQPSPSIVAVLCQRLGRPKPFDQIGTWCSGVTSASHAEGPGLKSQCVHFVIHMPSSTGVAPELRARIPAALSCTTPLTQSLQPNVWHSDVIHIVAQTLATTILKCKV
jgi:hypothetical protein